MNQLFKFILLMFLSVLIAGETSVGNSGSKAKLEFRTLAHDLNIYFNDLALSEGYDTKAKLYDQSSEITYSEILDVINNVVLIEKKAPPVDSKGNENPIMTNYKKSPEFPFGKIEIDSQRLLSIYSEKERKTQICHEILDVLDLDRYYEFCNQFLKESKIKVKEPKIKVKEPKIKAKEPCRVEQTYALLIDSIYLEENNVWFGKNFITVEVSYNTLPYHVMRLSWVAFAEDVADKKYQKNFNNFNRERYLRSNFESNYFHIQGLEKKKELPVTFDIQDGSKLLAESPSFLSIRANIKLKEGKQFFSKGNNHIYITLRKKIQNICSENTLKNTQKYKQILDDISTLHIYEGPYGTNQPIIKEGIEIRERIEFYRRNGGENADELEAFLDKTLLALKDI